MYFLMPSDGKAGDLLWDKTKDRYFLVLTIKDKRKDWGDFPFWEYELLDLVQLKTQYIALTDVRAVAWIRNFPLDESAVSDKVYPWRQR